LKTAVEVTGHPERLAALCDLWRRERREVRLTLQGGSMSPAIRAGSRLRVACGDAEPAIGEVIAALYQDRLVIHRLIRVERDGAAEDRYICRGDANPQADAPITRGQIVGVVREHRAPSLAHRVYTSLLRRVRGGLRFVRRGSTTSVS
jgi:hypothetical protein